MLDESDLPPTFTPIDGSAGAFIDRRSAIDELRRITDIAPETATERAETVAGICSLLGLLLKSPFPVGEDRA